MKIILFLNIKMISTKWRFQRLLVLNQSRIKWLLDILELKNKNSNLKTNLKSWRFLLPNIQAGMVKMASQETISLPIHLYFNCKWWFERHLKIIICSFFHNADRFLLKNPSCRRSVLNLKWALFKLCHWTEILILTVIFLSGGKSKKKS